MDSSDRFRIKGLRLSNVRAIAKVYRTPSQATITMRMQSPQAQRQQKRRAG